MRKTTFFLKLAILFIIFSAASYWVYFLSLLLNLHQKSLPKTISDLQLLITDLQNTTPPPHVVNNNIDKITHNSISSPTLFIFYTSVYLYEQAFCLPGCLLLNILAGALYPTPTAISLTSVLTALGSTTSYLFSKYTFGWLISSLFKKRVLKINRFYNAYARNNTSNKNFSENTRFVASMRMLPVMDFGNEISFSLKNRHICCKN